MKINNCSSCGGKVEFSPEDKGLKCEKCSNVFPIEYAKAKEKKRLLDAMMENDRGFEEWKDSKRIFSCKNCGAQIILDKFEMASKCSYCNTHSLITTDTLPGLKPDAVIPFKIGKNKAVEQFKIRTRQKMFLPNDFKKNIPKTNIGSTYLSSLSFAIDAFATYNGIRAVSKTVRTDDGYKTVTEYVPFSGEISCNFGNIIVECSEKIEQSQINSILPYDFKECCDYNDDFMTGYSCEYYNRSIKSSMKVAYEQALSLLDGMIRRKHSGVRSVTIKPKYSNEKYHYVLLPIYFINFKYKDRKYLNLMNGQTGKTSGEVPRSATKITFFTLFIVLLVIGLPLLIILLSSIT